MIGEHLHLDVPGPGQQRLAEHGPVAERGLRLAAAPTRSPPARSPAACTARMPRPPPPADALTSTGNLVTEPGIEFGQDRHAGCPQARLRASILSAIASHGLGRRADPGQAGVQHLPGERRVLGKEPVAGMHRIGPGGERGRDDRGAVQVGLRRTGAGQPDGQIGLGDVRRAGVRIGEHRHRADPSRTAGPEDPAGDLAPVGDKQGADHGTPLHILKTP